MPSATAKKTTKSMQSSSASTRRAPKSGVKSVKIYPLKGTLTEERAEEIIRSHGGRPTTPAEAREFRKFIKDPYP
jgi:hypothetical protein